MNDRNLGKLYINNTEIRRNPDEVAQVFKLLNLVVVRAECMFARDEIEYMAISDQFEEIKLGDQVPEYLIIIKKDDNGIVNSAKAEMIVPKDSSLTY